ncbi:MAG: proteasome-activating nucleotidase [Candidatus Lokiarchaeota archaeon]|nr:proteasome-activating nucleotidase [Candidatus Lokiarchaeota archaeon]
MNSIDVERKRKEEDEDTRYLEKYLLHLEARIKEYQNIILHLKSDISKNENEIKSLKKEIDSLSESPLITGEVEDMLDELTRRVIVRINSGATYIVNSSNRLTNQELSPGQQVALNQRNFSVVEALPQNIEPYIKNMVVEGKTTGVSYSDIGGLENQIQEVRESVELPLLKPEIFIKIGIEAPKGALFYGPPGTGKTLLARAVANETNATFIKVVATELVQKFIGEGARCVRDIFELAKKLSPSIIFIDEIDAIGAVRMEDATSGDHEVNRTLMQLLSELDGFDQRGDVKFIAATNRVDILDPALLRAGRFDRIIEFPMPDKIGREQIFRVHLRGINMEDIDINHLVNLTEGKSGVDIKAICTEAGMFAIRRESEIVSKEDFLNAINKSNAKNRNETRNPNFFI